MELKIRKMGEFWGEEPRHLPVKALQLSKISVMVKI
jgi:hypothetical protein